MAGTRKGAKRKVPTTRKGTKRNLENEKTEVIFFVGVVVVVIF